MGILLSWAAHALWGWLPNPLIWFFIGLAFALVPIASILNSLYPLLGDHIPYAWVHAIDSRLQLRQQLSTAWEVSQSKEQGPVAELLVQEITGIFPGASDRILKGGWFRKLDAAAAGLVALLVFGLLATLLVQPPPRPAVVPPPPEMIPQAAPQQPPQEQPPAAKPEQQPAGPGPESSGSPNSQNGQPAGDQSAGDQPGSESSANAAAVANALRQLGQDLSRQAGTYDLGQALENLDMNSAADALQDMNNQLDELSPESRQNLSQSLDKASGNLDGANPQSLSEDMQDAAKSLNDNKGNPEGSLGQVAQDLRQLGSTMPDNVYNGAGRAGPGKNPGRGQQSEPFERLRDENGQMEIPQEKGSNSGLLSPALPDKPGNGTASGSLDADRPGGNQAGQSPLLPNSFLWRWRNVVSQYFQR